MPAAHGSARSYPKEGVVQARRLAIARIAHEVNRAYCQALGDDSQPAWEQAPDWQKDSAYAGVVAHLASDLTPEQSHESWLAVKRGAGWVYGPVKDPEARTHPCIRPYHELPPEQRAKDHLFRAVVHACKHYRLETL